MGQSRATYHDFRHPFRAQVFATILEVPRPWQVLRILDRLALGILHRHEQVSRSGLPNIGNRKPAPGVLRTQLL